MNVSKGMIYIVEDDASFRKSMERLLHASDFETISCESATCFLAEKSIQHPACLLLDVRLPDIDGLDLQQALAEKGVHLPIVFMTGHGTIPMSVQAMKDGAIDFLPKPFDSTDLLDAIGLALERDRQHQKEQFEQEKLNELLDSLTPREQEILRWVITGKLNKQIAWKLGIAEKTVKVHRARVLQKLQVTSVAELVRFAEKANIAPAE